MKRVTGISLLIVALAGAVWWWHGLPDGPDVALRPEAAPVGQEQPRERCAYENGINVCDYGDATLKDVYLRYAEFLGEPVGGFDSRCQTFRFNKLCFNPANPPGWQIEFSNAGLADLQANGLVPLPGAELHPAVRDWLIGQVESGLDTRRVVGRIISPAICDKARCRQWTDKSLFVFAADATAASQVQRAPLGLWSVPRPQPTQTTSPGLLLLVGAGTLAAVGAVLLLIGRGSRQPVTI
jgi:hypothetical protein